VPQLFKETKMKSVDKERISGKSKFSDPLEIKYQREKDKPVDGKDSPWDFRCPQYDQRSSNFIQGGTTYGIGRTNPVGHKGDPKMRVPTMPFGRIPTMRDDEEA
jgi:hypothetical protein